jgi:hypothetical protein
MRTLTTTQKKLLKQWFTSNYNGGYKFNLADKIDADTYNKIEELHPTEIHYQNVNNYLVELVDKLIK